MTHSTQNLSVSCYTKALIWAEDRPGYSKYPCQEANSLVTPAAHLYIQCSSDKHSRANEFRRYLGHNIFILLRRVVKSQKTPNKHIRFSNKIVFTFLDPPHFGSRNKTSSLLDFVVELTCSDSVLKGALIEDVGWEGTECWVHTVLYLQTNGTDPQHHQPFKQRLGQACFGSFLTHDNRTQLAMITNKDQLYQINKKERQYTYL